MQAVEELTGLFSLCQAADTGVEMDRARGGALDYTPGQLAAVVQHFGAVEDDVYALRDANGILEALGYMMERLAPVGLAGDPVAAADEEAGAARPVTVRVGSIAWYAEKLDDDLFVGARLTVRQAAHAWLQVKDQGSIHDAAFDTLCALAAAAMPVGNYFPRCELTHVGMSSCLVIHLNVLMFAICFHHLVTKK